MNEPTMTAIATEMLAQLIELVGRATAYDRVIGSLALTNPAELIRATELEVIRCENQLTLL